MKTNFFLFTAIISLGMIFQGCEKEENDMVKTHESTSTKTTTMNNKTDQNVTRKTFIADDDVGFYGCLAPATDCLQTVEIYGLSGTLNTFFDEEDYIPLSFYNNYSLATATFDSDLVDDVIGGTISVRMHTNTTINNNIYVLFEDNNNDVLQVYEYII